jgi:endonuclease/exonuclease/phosphatase family metal-dependent hydrolase
VSGRHAIAAFIAATVTAANGLAATAPPKVPDVTFVAWNVRNYMMSPVKNRDGRITTPAKPVESAKAVAATLARLKPDIVGLSEIGSRKDLANLQRRLKQLGIDLPHRTWVDGADRERHLALLSRFPLRAAHDTKSGFVLGGLPYRVQRGFLDCTIAICPGFELRVLGAHLKSRRIVPEFDQAEFRRNESLILRAKIDGILRGKPDSLLLLFGDLNDNKNSPAVAGVAGRRGGATSLEILELADKVGDQWTYHWSESDEYSRVDYVMASKALLPLLRKKKSMVYRAAQWEEASDHRPLVVKIGLPAAKTTP